MTDFALIFDLDGVIADTGEMHEKAWFAYCKKYNLAMTSEMFRNTFFGRSNREIFEILLHRKIDENELGVLADEKESLFRQIANGKLTPTPGLIPFLDEVKRAEIKVCVASSAPKINVEFTLQQTATAKYFERITSAEDVKHSKPDPEIFLLAAQKMGYPPEKCLVFEDSFAGIEAAQRAGMKLIILASTHPLDELPDEFPRIRDFINSRLDIIQKLF